MILYYSCPEEGNSSRMVCPSSSYVVKWAILCLLGRWEDNVQGGPGHMTNKGPDHFRQPGQKPYKTYSSHMSSYWGMFWGESSFCIHLCWNPPAYARQVSVGRLSWNHCLSLLESAIQSENSASLCCCPGFLVSSLVPLLAYSLFWSLRKNALTLFQLPFRCFKTI